MRWSQNFIGIKSTFTGDIMRRLKKIGYILILLCTLLGFSSIKVMAEDEGYYIENIDVSVVVNDKREYIITETIDVNFKEERHGIIRKIPKSSYLEEYEITDVSVEGAKSEISHSYDMEIKIGDEDNTVKGDKQYIIKYTLKHFSDEQPEGDYIYLNILGDQWDTKIEKFTSKIIYPKNAELKKITVTSGEYGAKENNLVNYEVKDNIIYFSSKRTIEPNNSITVNAMLNEGAFSKAPLIKHPYIINEENINMHITKEKEYLINKEYIINILDEDKYNSIKIWENFSRVKISDVKINNDNFTIDEKSEYIILPRKSGEYKVNVTYKITPSMDSSINVGQLLGDVNSKIEELNIKVSSDVPILDYNVMFSELGLNLGRERYEVNKIDNHTITFKSLTSLNKQESIDFLLDMNEEMFYRALPKSVNIFYAISFISIIVAFIIAYILRDKNKIIPAVEIYPPKDLNPAEVSYIYNKFIGDSDLTKLIFYWASKGYLEIIMTKNENFKLKKVRDISVLDKEKIYEKVLFDAMFRHGDGKVVTKDNLKDKFYINLNNAVHGLKSNFRKEKKIINGKSIFTMILCTLINIIPLSIFAYIVKEITITSFENMFICVIIGIIECVALTIILYFLNFDKDIKEEKGSKIFNYIFSIGLYGVIVAIELFICNIPIVLKIIIFITTALISIFSSQIPRRNQYSKEKLAEIVGFRIFIKVAEKDRLEKLIEEEPQYFYDTLPYAQVLNLTKVWQNKFKDIELPPPVYYSPYGPAYSIDRMMLDMALISKGAVYNQSSDLGSSSGGGFSGGGFSGGGFSGGGSGGGGGSSW